MAEAFHDALQRRLGLIGDMSAGANKYAQQMSVRQPGGAGMIRQPGFSSGVRQPGGRGNLAALIAFGKELERRGYRVGENPHFGSGRVGRHTKGSRHYSGRAIDVNWGPGGQSAAEMKALDKIMGLAQQYGLRSIWRQPGHYNHAHFDF